MLWGLWPGSARSGIEDCLDSNFSVGPDQVLDSYDHSSHPEFSRMQTNPPETTLLYSQKVLWISWNLEGSRTLLISLPIIAVIINHRSDYHNTCDNQGMSIVGYFKRENATGSCPATLWVTRADRRKKVCCLVSGPTLAKLFERVPAENAFNRLAHRGGLIFFSNLWNLYM